MSVLQEFVATGDHFFARDPVDLFDGDQTQLAYAFLDEVPFFVHGQILYTLWDPFPVCEEIRF